jgi:hypothetical protein
VSVAFTHQVGGGAALGTIKATKPTDAESSITTTVPVGRTTLPMAAESGCR